MSNFLNNLDVDEGKYQSGGTTSAFTHDADAGALLTDILTELKKTNIHLRYLSGVDVESYNVTEGS